MGKLKIGMIGLGKLGLPCLLAMEKHGQFQIFGYDANENTREAIKAKKVSYWEENVNEYLESSRIDVVDSVSELVDKCDMIFVAVQTPHDPKFEGLEPIPLDRQDFDYSYLRSSILEVTNSLKKNARLNPLIVVISTVLPGTMRTEIIPIISAVRSNYRFAYNPYFIAMGTTIKDFLNPEFILVGSDSSEDLNDLSNFYSFLKSKIMPMEIESAELTKVAYNTFIGFKIVFANAISEIVEVRGGNVDEITNALGQATDRLMSPKYLSAGMGDGGGCHPRDQIAMSWLAKKIGMSVDIFEFIAKARDEQTRKQAELIISISLESKLPIKILGKAYKENSPLTVGSPAILLTHYFEKSNIEFEHIDPWVDNSELKFEVPSVFFIASKHKIFKNLNLPNKSVMVDPWGYFENSNNEVILITPGRGKNGKLSLNKP